MPVKPNMFTHTKMKPLDIWLETYVSNHPSGSFVTCR